MPVRIEKQLLATALDRLGHHAVALSAQRLFASGAFIRAVNYHSTPVGEVKTFRAQLEFFKTHYSDVSYADLCQFFENGRWEKSKPGLILSFDDGYQDNATVAAPLLEEFGFTGWFFVPSQFVLDGNDSSGQNKTVRSCMTVPELKQLAQRHVIGSHTRTHCRLRASAGAQRLRQEIVDSKQELEGLLGREVGAFCWVGGEEDAYSQLAAQYVEEAGYHFSFMTNSAPITPQTHRLQLQRSNVEVDYPLPVVRFQLSGLLDVLYTPKRRRVNALTHKSTNSTEAP